MTISLACPPWTALGRKLESMVRKALYDYKMLEDTPHLALALSGGKDSLTLLFLLKAVLGKGFSNIPLTAIHVSGEFSCGAGVNQDYLKAICQALEVPFLVRESTQTLDKLECYSCSRERRRLLFEAAKSVGAKTVAFGHHQDDHAQTLLMNLFHKGEFAGNLPKIKMQDYGVTLIRPLIYLAEEEIRKFAKQYEFARLSCGCPVGQNSMRKKTDQLLKEIELLFPHSRENIARAGLIYGSQKAAIP